MPGVLQIPTYMWVYVLILFIVVVILFIVRNTADRALIHLAFSADAAALWVRERSQSVLKQNRWLHCMPVGLTGPPHWILLQIGAWRAHLF